MPTENTDDLIMEFKQLTANLATMQHQVVKMLAENEELRIENQHLHDLLDAHEKKHQGVQVLSKSKQNLEKLYNDGYHICNQYYGKSRLQNESCIFCTEIIYGER
ncbi:DNA replication initiation control protein YabA [Fructilactobacillus florum 8D]|uniref:DNA replication initiation control protein YabA n=2 Tax=Fructilactobacillus florum TaxID=640331 RepID=W9EGA2_9LACO|nr:DNA replication initiation control protein YabA [Fructilactobacillus florum]EKK20033.1 DNA replication initiation control protein YabA [Fructilactobacillus florum 2F]ETO40291.1 DNA replication initiation control protein YabA [Fructilactobacillus florum 8D]KRM92552.1 hypothetical protein FC87_GL000164 [Fructilactobacillus florum DSM 22689 = JCM 16035]